VKPRYERFIEMTVKEGAGHPPMTDFVPLSYGSEDCAPGHKSEGIRDYFMIHYVSSGRGTLEYREKKTEVGAGSLFIISPGEWHRYIASVTDPWNYTWLCFRGARAEELTSLAPVQAYSGDAFQRLLHAAEYGNAAAEYVAACYFDVLSYLLREAEVREGDGYAERARRMVDTLYMLPLTVGDIAEQLSLDRRYLPRLFRQRYGITLQEYLIRTRMESAARYLREGYNAEESGRLSGYEDPVNFYRMFKRYYGEGPAAYRRRFGVAGAPSAPQK